MISIVVCSVSPEKLEAFKINVESTIGVEYEFVVVDNRVENYSLCKAYNVGAEKAKYPYLCFAHEDIAFHTQNWGEKMVEQLSLPSTGVIGFAGSQGKSKTMTTWNLNERYKRINILETIPSGTRVFSVNPDQDEFSKVVTLDGLCLFVRRDVWAEVRFDDINFDGFHLYDLDFATSVFANGYMNYVCHTVLVEHFSKGSFNETWYKYSVVYHQKWNDKLPLYSIDIDEDRKAYNERLAYRSMSYMLIKRSLEPKKELRKRVSTCYRYFPFHFKPTTLLIRYVISSLKSSKK